MELIDRDGKVLMQMGEVQTSARAGLVVTPHSVTLEGQHIGVESLMHNETLAAFLARTAGEVDAEGWVVAINGAEVPAQFWALTRPKPGVLIECRRRLRNGGILRLAAVVAISYFTLGPGGLGTSGLFASGGIVGGGFFAAAAAYVVGTMLVNKLLTPQQASIEALQSNTAGATYSLAASNNQSRPYEPLGLLFGQVRITPDFSSQPFTWYEGQNQYLYEVLHGGINCASVGDIRIGKTPLGSYSDWETQFEGFPSMPNQPLGGWANVDSVAGAKLVGGPDLGSWQAYTPGEWVTRTTSVNTMAVQIDLDASLYWIADDGKVGERTADIELQYRLLPSGAWQALDLRHYSSASTDTIRESLTYGLPLGQYEIRLRKNTADKSSNREANTFAWSYLKSVQPDSGYYAGIGRVGLKMRASGQLSGTLDTVNWLGQSRAIPVWNGSAWVTATTRDTGASNPGALMLQYMRGIYGPDGRLHAGMGLSDDMIDFESLQGFMVRCTAMNFRFDWYLDQTMSHQEVLSNMAAVGLGSLAWPRGKWGVMWFQENELESGVVNMATMTDGTFKVDYLTLDTSDGLEYQYFDRYQDFTWVSLRVKSPNVETALNPARITSVGVTEEAHAALLARFHMAQSEFQRKSITFDTDLEHLTYQRGAVLRLSHDLTQWGYGGRLFGAEIVAGSVQLTLDDVLPAGSGGFIGLRLLGDKTCTVFPVQPLTEESRVVTLVNPWPGSVPFPGAGGTPVHDIIWLYDFKATPGYRVRVTEIQPDSDMSGATVTCVPEGDEFWAYVLYGAYTPPVNQSRRPALPEVTKIEVTEQLIRQGNTFAVTLTLTMDFAGSVDHVEIWGATAGNTLHRLGTASGRRFVFTGGVSDVWSFEARPYDGFGRLGTVGRVDYAVLGLSLPPSNIPWFRIDGNTLTWGVVADVDLLGYLIRYHYGDNPSWGDAHPLHDGVVTDTPYTPPATPQGPLTLMIRAVDTSGNLSEVAAVIRTQFGDVLVTNVVETYDFQAMGYPGSLANASKVGGQIVADNTSLFYRDDAANFYSQYDSAQFFNDNYAPLIYVTTVIAPSRLAEGSAMTLDVDFAGDAQFIEYRTTGSQPMFAKPDAEVFYGADGAPFYTDDGDFMPWPGRITSHEVLYQFRFQTGRGANQGRIGKCVAVIDIPDVIERFNDVAVPAGGMRLVLSKTWYSIDNIQLTLQDDGGSAVMAKWLDKNIALGPRIACYDATGAMTSGNVDVILQGK